MLLYPNGGALWLAAKARTALATSVLKLYTALANPLTPSTVVADFTEADFSGYAAATITNFLLPYIDPAGGATIQSGTIQFGYVAPMSGPIGNTVLGFYLVDSTGALIVAGSFDAGVTMNANGDAIPINVALNYGKS